MSQRTLVLVKPDGVRRGLVGEVLGRIERKGYRLVALELRTLDEAAAAHYGEHEGKPFFDDLVTFITSGPLVALWPRARGHRGLAHARGRHRPGQGSARARSAATSPRDARTSSTARTRPSRPRARSPCSSPA